MLNTLNSVIKIGRRNSYSRSIPDDLNTRVGLRLRTTRSAAVTLTSQAITFATTFIGSIWLARLLSPDDFGLIAMVVAVTGFLDTFKDLGLSAATIQQPTITTSQVNTFFWINVIVGAVFALSCWALAPALVLLYKRQELFLITIVFSFGFFASGCSSQQHALLRRAMRFDAIARIDILSILISTTLGIIFATLHAGVWSLVAQRLTRSTISSLGYWTQSRWIPGRPKWDPSAKGMLRFGGYLAGSNILTYAARNVDNIAIGSFWGASVLGLYSRAYNLLMLPLSQIASPLSNVALPAFSRLQSEPKRLRDVALTLIRLSALILVPGVAILISCSDSVITLLLGPKWIAAAHIYRWFAIVALIQPVTVTCGVLFTSQGKSRELAQVTLINSTVSVLSIIAAVPWGATAVAASFSIGCLLIRTPVVFYYAGTISAITTRDLYASLLPALCVGISIVAINFLVLGAMDLDNSIINILVASFTAFICALLGLIAFPTQRAALHEARSLFRNVVKK